MIDTKPEVAPSVTLANNLRRLGGWWVELDNLLGHNEGAARGGSREGRVPINLNVLDTMRAIEGFAHAYARMLMNDDMKWRKPTGGCNVLLNALADRVGHFMNTPMTKELAALNKQAEHTARPDGKANIPLGIPCFADECTGEMRVPIDRDHPIPANGLTLWRPTATCSQDATHQCDARLLAHGVTSEVDTNA